MEIKYVTVYDNVIASMMLSEGYVYLARDFGDPYTFIGAEASERATDWNKLVNTEIPISLTFRDLCMLTALIDNDCTGFYEQFGDTDCRRKLCEGLKKIDKEMDDKENG